MLFFFVTFLDFISIRFTILTININMKITSPNFLTHSLQHLQIHIDQHTILIILTFFNNTFLTLSKLADWFNCIDGLKFDYFLFLSIYTDFLFYHVFHFLFVLGWDYGWGCCIFWGILWGFHAWICCIVRIAMILWWNYVRLNDWNILLIGWNILRNIENMIILNPSNKIRFTISMFSWSIDHFIMI